MPSAPGKPSSTPSAESSASVSPARMRIGTPGIRACSAATKAGPLLASRTAAVASTSSGSARMARATAW